jgi:hypothetical protein
MKIIAAIFAIWGLCVSVDAISAENVPPSSEFVKEIRTAEAKLLHKFPAFAARKTNFMTISYGGKSVARFEDKDEPWTFCGILRLYDSKAKALVSLAIVQIHHSESEDTFVVEKDGTIDVFGEEILPSGDGRLLASGFANIEVSGPLEIYEWDSPNHATKYVFKVSCAPKNGSVAHYSSPIVNVVMTMS